MLPVGAINEKIEGYFRSCELLGLDGAQGVLIPQRNRRHLMLSPRVVDAVAAGRFHIHTADHAGDGMELLTGQPFGSLGPHGYPADTVLGRRRRHCSNSAAPARQASGTRRPPQRRLRPSPPRGRSRRR